MSCFGRRISQIKSCDEGEHRRRQCRHVRDQQIGCWRMVRNFLLLPAAADQGEFIGDTVTPHIRQGMHNRNFDSSSKESRIPRLLAVFKEFTGEANSAQGHRS